MQNIKLNLVPGSVMPVVNVSQYDKARQFSLTVYEGAATYSLTGKDVQIRGTKPDGNGFAYDSTYGVVSVSGSTVTISTTQQMTAVGGQTMAELRITQSGVILGTLNFVLMVEPSALSDDTPISDTDIPAIERDFEAALAEAEADALKAEGYAVGTQDGVPAQSGEPYYQDNAKYYKEQAEAAASGGGADALKAEGYAVGTQNGAPVTSGSPYYHNNAEYYEGEASTSATNAGNSETAAAGSASAASADALKSEGFAVGEQGGTPVGPTSPYYQNNAAYYAAQAGQYATGGLIFKGSVAFANIPTTGMVNGDMYNITDDFTTDSRFIEGAGVAVKAGADIAFVAGSVNKWDILALGGGGGADALDDLTDVDITMPADGDLLQYNSTSQKWENSDAIPDELTAMQENGAVNILQTIIASQVISGVTVTNNGDGTLTLSSSGAISGNVSINVNYDGTYAGCVTDGTKYAGKDMTISTGLAMARAGVFIKCNYYKSNQSGAQLSNYTGTTDTFTTPSDISKFAVFIYINNGTDLTTPVTIKPMLYDARLVNPPYQLFTMTNRELTDGKVNTADIATTQTNDNTKVAGAGLAYEAWIKPKPYYTSGGSNTWVDLGYVNTNQGASFIEFFYGRVDATINKIELQLKKSSYGTPATIFNAVTWCTLSYAGSPTIRFIIDSNNHLWAYVPSYTQIYMICRGYFIVGDKATSSTAPTGDEFTIKQLAFTS